MNPKNFCHLHPSQLLLGLLRALDLNPVHFDIGDGLDVEQVQGDLVGKQQIVNLGVPRAGRQIVRRKTH